MEDHIRPELVAHGHHGVAIVDPHGADVGRQDLVVEAGQWPFGGEEAATPATGRHPSRQRVQQVAPELPVGSGDQYAHRGNRRQPAAAHPASTTGARARSGSHQARLAAYHSTVWANPSSQEISGAQPSWSRSLDESSR
jgi:hypothetical protein